MDSANTRSHTALVDGLASKRKIQLWGLKAWAWVRDLIDAPSPPESCEEVLYAHLISGALITGTLTGLVAIHEYRGLQYVLLTMVLCSLAYTGLVGVFTCSTMWKLGQLPCFMTPGYLPRDARYFFPPQLSFTEIVNDQVPAGFALGVLLADVLITYGDWE